MRFIPHTFLVKICTAARVIRIVWIYDFDPILLDIDLDGSQKGSAVAGAIAASRNTHTPALLRSMNTLRPGNEVDCLPHAVSVWNHSLKSSYELHFYNCVGMRNFAFLFHLDAFYTQPLRVLKCLSNYNNLQGE